MCQKHTIPTWWRREVGCSALDFQLQDPGEVLSSRQCLGWESQELYKHSLCMWLLSGRENIVLVCPTKHVAPAGFATECPLKGRWASGYALSLRLGVPWQVVRKVGASVSSFSPHGRTSESPSACSTQGRHLWAGEEAELRSLGVQGRRWPWAF